MKARTPALRGIAGDVAAVFPDRRAAQVAVDELCEQGADPQLRTALAGTEARVYELDLGAEVRRRVTRGALIGLPVGALLGALLVSAALAGGAVAGLSWLDGVLAGALPGLVAGLVFGGFAGLVTAFWVFEDIDRWMTVQLRAGEVLVVARAHRDAWSVRRVLVSHGGRPVGKVAVARPRPGPSKARLRHRGRAQQSPA